MECSLKLNEAIAVVQILWITKMCNINWQVAPFHWPCFQSEEIPIRYIASDVCDVIACSEVCTFSCAWQPIYPYIHPLHAILYLKMPAAVFGKENSLSSSPQQPGSHAKRIIYKIIYTIFAKQCRLSLRIRLAVAHKVNRLRKIKFIAKGLAQIMKSLIKTWRPSIDS